MAAARRVRDAASLLSGTGAPALLELSPLPLLRTRLKPSLLLLVQITLGRRPLAAERRQPDGPAPGSAELGGAGGSAPTLHVRLGREARASGRGAPRPFLLAPALPPFRTPHTGGQGRAVPSGIRRRGALGGSGCREGGGFRGDSGPLAGSRRGCGGGHAQLSPEASPSARSDAVTLQASRAPRNPGACGCDHARDLRCEVAAAR
ncbi:unnamed protein product [Rangifer tarandus platyrhynchus]|uniref:Uncharacterized protein n=1 Tax=Rangifer tarandus platyrhynchus TaxID=3082113 RepID=A0ABN8Z9J3_RANTA|nr:unnamed protein product [Rangifer tarandus platyrhynchus]